MTLWSSADRAWGHRVRGGGLTVGSGGKAVLIEWNEEQLSVGVPEFDSEHRKLITRVNEIYALLDDSPDLEAIETVLSTLRTEVQAHFANEEAYMERTGSPRLENHRILHDILLTDLDRLIAESRQDEFHYLREDLEYDIKPWLVEHIVNIDKKLPSN